MIRSASQLRHLLKPGSEDVVIQADLVEFLDDLELAGTVHADEMANEVISAMGQNIEHLAKRYAPRDTGELVSSITRDDGFLESRVHATAPHAVFIEFGTWSYNELAPQSGTYEIKPTNARALAFQVNGQTVFAKSVQHPGIPAQPFLRPALADTIDEFTEGMSNVGVSILMGDT